MRKGGAVVIPENLWIDKENDFKKAFRDEGRIDSVYVKKKDLFVKFYTLPGHQGKLINNVYAVKMPSKNFIMHTGDQANSDDFSWIDNLFNKIRIDILIPNCWTTDLPRMKNGVKPDLIIMGHENEMGHTVSHRESFEKSYKILDKVLADKAVLNWGEKFIYFLSDKIM